MHAAAGGAGLLLVQLARAAGATVIGTVSTAEKERLVREAGAALGHYAATRDELRCRAGAVLDAVRAGTLRVRIGAEYPLADAATAHADLEGRRSTGKLILLPR